MREREQGYERRFGPPRGEPGRPLVEAIIVFSAFYLASYLSAGVPAIAPSRPEYHLLSVAVNLPRILLVLYLMAAGDGLPLFGIGRFVWADLPRGALTALGAFAIMLAASFLFSAIGLQNPLFAGAGSGRRAGAAVIPFFLVSSMATGYCEELFFRSYLMRRLGQGGMPLLWSALASSLLFGAGHAYQGVVGLVSGSVLGLYFAWRWSEAKNIHVIAIGHGLYDVAAFAVLLYS